MIFKIQKKCAYLLKNPNSGFNFNIEPNSKWKNWKSWTHLKHARSFGTKTYKEIKIFFLTLMESTTVKSLLRPLAFYLVSNNIIFGKEKHFNITHEAELAARGNMLCIEMKFLLIQQNVWNCVCIQDIFVHEKVFHGENKMFKAK